MRKEKRHQREAKEDPEENRKGKVEYETYF